MSIVDRARTDIRDLKAYVSGRATEPRRDGLIWLDTNELPLDDLGLNRYPDPQPQALIDAAAAHYGVRHEHLLATAGSDQAIDLICRAFCSPGDRVLYCPPTFGMYKIAASLSGAEAHAVPLDFKFDVDIKAVLAAIETQAPKVVFLCSPNNPSGNTVPPSVLERIVNAAHDKAVVVLDGAYADFAEPSLPLPQAENLVVLRTLSKAHGLAAARLGFAIGDPELLGLLRKILPPYPLPQPSIDAGIGALAPERLQATQANIAILIAERKRLGVALLGAPAVATVWPSAANFLLIEAHDNRKLFAHWRRAGIITRYFADIGGRDGIRVSIGTRAENDALLAALESYA